MSSQDELQQEYQFDYLKGKPNRFASVAPESPVVVTLDDDVSCVFTTPEAVNRALRAADRCRAHTRSSLAENTKVCRPTVWMT